MKNNFDKFKFIGFDLILALLTEKINVLTPFKVIQHFPVIYFYLLQKREKLKF